MTTTFQLSDKGGDTGQAILLIKVEAPDQVSPDVAWGVFVQAVAEAGLQDTIDNFDALKTAVANAKAGLGAQPVQQAAPAQPAVASGGWGQPPVPPMQSTPQLPAAAAAPAVGAAPTCHHGVKEFISGVTKSGKNAGKTWKAWACPADRDDPSKCEKEWIRD